MVMAALTAFFSVAALLTYQTAKADLGDRSGWIPWIIVFAMGAMFCLVASGL